MLIKHFVLSSALAVAAAAVPAPAVAITKGTDMVAKFDDLVLDDSTITAIGVYQKIFWNGFQLAPTPKNNQLPGLIPNTPYNFAAYSKTNLITDQQGTAAMQAQYAGSTTDSFDLKSFYYGCALPLKNTLAGVAEDCTIVVVAFSDVNASQEKGRQSFNFKKGTGAQSQQMLATITEPGFDRIKVVQFLVSGVASALVDTVDYVMHAK